jgi:hypothetical protein
MLGLMIWQDIHTCRILLTTVFILAIIDPQCTRCCYHYQRRWPSPSPPSLPPVQQKPQSSSPRLKHLVVTIAVPAPAAPGCGRCHLSCHCCGCSSHPAPAAPSHHHHGLRRCCLSSIRPPASIIVAIFACLEHPAVVVLLTSAWLSAFLIPAPVAPDRGPRGRLRHRRCVCSSHPGSAAPGRRRRGVCRCCMCSIQPSSSAAPGHRHHRPRSCSTWPSWPSSLSTLRVQLQPYLCSALPSPSWSPSMLRVQHPPVVVVPASVVPGRGRRHHRRCLWSTWWSSSPLLPA